MSISADPTKRVAELKPINSYFQVGTEVTYVYDFGADWTHYILCENILPMKQAESYPKCTDGKKDQDGHGMRLKGTNTR